MALAACGPSSGPEYTLYRSSSLDSTLRVHWASFNAAESGSYNQENCQMAADLLMKNLRELNNGEEPVRFWCELGTYRP
jgi:hypothetical protein